MDYEKAYKAVLQTATQWIKDGCTDKEKICLECVFPELRESEDERIRKILIRIVKGACNKYGIKYKGDEITEEKLLDYLEKQKENPKSADSIPADCVSDVKCEDRSPKHSDSFGTDIRDTPAYWRGWDDAMEQKEQKPVEWNKKPCLTCQEYKKGFEAGRLEGVTAGYNKAVKEKEQKPAEWSEDTIRKAIEEVGLTQHQINWFKNNVFPPKQEWSEEDKVMLNNIIWSVHMKSIIKPLYEMDDRSRYKKYEDFLKALPERFNLQPRTEWSEEDKQKLNRIYEILGYAADDKGFLTSKRIIGDKEAIELQDFLKSLHPDSYKNCNSRWSEEDNIGWDEAFACVTRAEKAAKNEEELQNAVTAEKWLKEIKFKYYVHPVKQEWSEEDEKALKRAIDCVRSWEIDYCDGDNRISERLKSLRPSWKPSEEQMEAFKGYIEDFQARAEAAVGGWNNFDVMIRLYEQLKKL